MPGNRINGAFEVVIALNNMILVKTELAICILNTVNPRPIFVEKKRNLIRKIGQLKCRRLK